MNNIPLKTETLVEALPYIQKYEGKTFVIKYGGAAMVNPDLRETFAQDITVLTKIGINIVIVHGGGREITATADRLGLTSTFVDGQRFTDEAMMDVVQMVLAGKTNKDIAAAINRHDGNAVGLCGLDADLLTARPAKNGALGFVGEVEEVRSALLNLLLANRYIPVVAPIGIGHDRQYFNVNADLAASAIASALKAEKLIYLSDVEGIMVGEELIHSMHRMRAEELISDGIIINGMIPKIQSACAALDGGVVKVHMIDGRVTHALLLEMFTKEGIGTEVTPSPVNSLMEEVQ